MGKPKRSTDFNQRALEVVLEAIGEKPKQEPDEKDPEADSDEPTGRKGGEARAKKLTAKERSEIAKKAARARWAKKKKA